MKRILADKTGYLYNRLYLPLRSKNTGKFEKLLGFTRSHSIMTRGLVSVSGANTPHPFLVFSILKRLKSLKIFNFIKSSQNEGLDTNLYF